MNADQVLAIDNGTQSVRAIIFDLRGNQIAKVRVPIEPYTSPQPGFAEQDPNLFWDAVCKALKQLWQEPHVHKEAIAGLSVTTQRSTMINMDKEGKPLRPAIVWLDQRRSSGLPNLGGIWGLLFKAAGVTNTIRYFQAEAEINWIAKHQPEVLAKTHKYIMLSGYLLYRLSGEYRDSIGSQVGYIPLDYKKQDWAGPMDWKWQILPIKKEMLPELVQPSGLIGNVSAQASAETGLPEGLPIIAAAADKACEVIGAGCLDSNIACLSYGTSATINTTHQNYVEVIPMVPPYPAAVPGHYSMEVQVFRGYWMVSWFKREFGLNEERLSKERGVAPEELFNDLVNSAPPGCHGLMLQPYWSPGLKVPGPEAKGAIVGFGDVHTRAYLYRSILEGLAYALKEGADRTSHRSHVPISEIRVAGGGSQSDGAMQLTADIFGLPASRAHVYEASGLGAAMDLAVGLKLHPDFGTAVKEMSRISDTFEPIEANARLYKDLYERVYLKMYKNLQPLYDEIQQITGYPPND
ncbi:MAG: FGGY-family carbohydrate kinase [Anaerolineaceae bacterium]|nr:FGGY-family carbohydrate kinase [Anaerolineaceae bacterium]